MAAGGDATTIKLAWEKITLSIEVGPKKERTQKLILNGIDGEALPGEMLAVMGPSGSGKTSLLNALARRNDAFTGSLKMNGLDMRGRGMLFNSRTAYMHQDERFLPELTVKEHLMFQSRLRTNLSKAERVQRVESIMMELGLDKIATQVIGDQFGEEGNHISKNERKRLSFASELLTNPTLLFVDEPTTGLDSYMAESVVKTLKGLASGPRKCTIVATIHQPAAETYRLFDKVCFLVGGRVGYFGPLPDMVDFLAGLDFPLPMHCCPADHIMRLFVNPDDPKGSQERRVKIVDAFTARGGSATTQEQAVAVNVEQQVAAMEQADRESKTSRGYCTQVAILTAREAILRRRSVQAFKARMFQTVVFGLWFGLTYLRMDITQSSFFTVSGALFFCMMMMLFGGPMTVAQSVPPQVPVFIRENRGGSYHISAMYVSKMLVDIPTEALFTFIWTLITYWMIGFRGDRANGDFLSEFSDYFRFWGVLWLVSYNAFCFGYFAAFTAPVNVPEVGFLLTLLLMLPQMIFGGFFINLDIIPSWLHWIRDLCMLRYGFSLLNIVQWEDYGRVPCEGSKCLFGLDATGRDIMNSLASKDTVLQNILVVLAISIVFRCLAFLMLRRKARPAVFDSAAPDAGTMTLENGSADADAEQGSAIREAHVPITVTWNQVTFCPAGRPVLDNVSGVAKPGRLLVVMGPSGCGKTCLLNALTGRNQDITGSVLFNGAPWKAALASQVAYMHQEDMFLPDLTVREHLIFTSMLKMPSGTSRKERTRRIDEIIQKLGLTTCQSTLIGVIGAGISGGERKRLSLAAEILSDPSLLVVDEPTSGLDSAMAESVIQLLDKIAKGVDGSAPRTVIATIHQPSRDVFLNFSDLLILADGSVAYLGEASKAVDYFAGLNHACPADTNPPEHFMRLVSHHLGADTKLREESVARVKDITSRFARTQQGEAPVAAVANTGGDSMKAFHTSTGKQLAVLYRRETLLRRRSKLLFKAVIGRTIVLTILVGLVWLQLEAKGELPIIQSFMGVLQFIMINQFMTSGAGLVQTMPLLMPAMMRDHHNGLYNITSWYLSKVLADLPFEIIFPSLFTSGVFWLVGFGNLAPTTGGMFGMWGVMVLLAILTAQGGHSFGLLCSSLASNPAMGFGIFSALIFPWMFYSGLMINYDDIPLYFIWLHWSSPFKYIYTSLVVTVFEDAEFSCPAGSRCQYADGRAVLDYFAIKPQDFGRSIGALIALIVGFRIFAWVFFVAASKRINLCQCCKRRNKAKAVAGSVSSTQ